MAILIAKEPRLLVQIFGRVDTPSYHTTLRRDTEGFLFQGEDLPPAISAEIQEWLFLYSQKKAAPTLSFLKNYFTSSFSHQVLSSLLLIPMGHTKSYSSIAHSLGNPRAQRAVGGACNRNPFPLFLPCHRVVGAQGDLTGFAFGLEVKKSLLEFENY